MHRKSLAARHPIYGMDNVLICSRHQDSIFILHFPSKQIIWAWGRGAILGPHDAQVLDNGNIILFDNGLGRGWSRVIELDPIKRTIVWEYRADHPESFYSDSRGGCQRLPNGNTLIVDSVSGRGFEVTPGGEVVWDFYAPYFI